MSIVKIFQIVSISFPIAFALFMICGGRRKTDLSYGHVLLAMLVKTLSGLAYGYLFLTVYNGDDTWAYFKESLPQTRMLLEDPMGFLRELTPASALQHYQGFGVVAAYLADLEYYIQVKVLAIFNLVSFSDYYIDMCLLNGLFFLGHYWIYRLLMQRFMGNRHLVFAAVFLFLPAVFWLSGIRSDGYLFLFTALTLLSTARMIQHRPGPGTIIASVAGIAGMTIFRPAYGLMLIPALLTWWLIEKGHRRTGIALVAVYGSCLLLFLASVLVSPSRNGATIIAGRQAAFLKLEGNTRFDMEPLRPETIHIVSRIPEALRNTLIRPYPWEAKGVLQYFSVAENLVFLVLVLYFLMKIRRHRDFTVKDGFVVCVISWFFSVYILTGLTVPFPGAIIRYKSIAELLLLATLAAKHQNTLANKI